MLGSRDVRCGTLTCNFRVLAVDIRCRSLTCGIAMHMTPPPVGRKRHTISGRLHILGRRMSMNGSIEGGLFKASSVSSTAVRSAPRCANATLLQQPGRPTGFQALAASNSTALRTPEQSPCGGQ